MHIGNVSRVPLIDNMTQLGVPFILLANAFHSPGMHIGNVSRVPLIDIVHDEPEGFPDGEVVGLGVLDGEQTGPAEVVQGEDVVVAVALQQLPLVLLHQLLLEPIVKNTHETEQAEHLGKHHIILYIQSKLDVDAK